MQTIEVEVGMQQGKIVACNARDDKGDVLQAKERSNARC
jgi:hypothetical protein